MSDLESTSSSSGDEEELDRCREAAMPAWGLEQRPRGPEKPRAGRGLCSGSLAEGRRIFPCGLRMDGEEGVPGIRLLSARRLQGLGGVQSQSADKFSRERCSIIAVRETKSPECLLTLLPWVHPNCRTLGSPPPLRGACDPYWVFASSLSPPPTLSHSLGLPASCVLHVSLTVTP